MDDIESKNDQISLIDYDETYQQFSISKRKIKIKQKEKSTKLKF